MGPIVRSMYSMIVSRRAQRLDPVQLLTEIVDGALKIVLCLKTHPERRRRPEIAGEP